MSQIDLEAIRTAIYIVGAILGVMMTIGGFFLRRAIDQVDTRFAGIDEKLGTILEGMSALRERVTVLEVHAGIRPGAPPPAPAGKHK